MVRALEVRRVGVLRAANIAGIVGFVVYGAIALLMAPILIVMSSFVPQGPGEPPLWMFSIFLLAYPFLGAVFAWIAAALATATYNFATRWTGGMILEVEER